MNTGIKATKDGRRLYTETKNRGTNVLYFVEGKKGLYYHDGKGYKAVRSGRKIFWGEGNETYYRKDDWS